ncbi:MAG: amino acid racemase [Motiliproteus sp.]|nr:amino acid racemase [Motiliproteus sp.]MCW9053258.1 amino acid racemase [Motiliproteus sp.]
MSATIGILGGMGPLATLDFVEKIIDQTPARRDQDHLPLLIHSVPQIPDRTANLMGTGESPLDALLQGLTTLTEAGAHCIAIPCNTAHYWHPALAAKSTVPVLHIAEACAQQLSLDSISSVALMATDGTLKAGFYPEQLKKFGIDLSIPETALQQQIMDGIYRVKSGNIIEGGGLLENSLKSLLDQGVQRVILGCTEIPLALDRIESNYRHLGMDATRALAKACIDWYQQQNHPIAA